MRSARSCRIRSTLGSNVKLDVGLRYDFLPSPNEQDSKLVTFDPATASLLRIGSNGFDAGDEERQRLPAARSA